MGATVLEASGVVRRVTDHTYRRAVHSVIQVLDHGPFIDVWVQHAESCRGRGYPSLAREQTMEYFFENMFGRGIVSGDLNMSKVGVKSALHTWSSRTGHTQEDSDQRFKTGQIHKLPDSKHGDLALPHGLTATQIADLEDPLPRRSAPRSSPRVTCVKAALHILLPRLVA